MTAKIIDGVALAKSIRSQAAQRADRCKSQGRPPGLTVILVGDNPASQVYVRNKVKACEEVGIRSQLIQKPQSLDQSELLALIEQLNADPSVDGILVQLPLPPQIDAHRVIESIAADKDVDGFHVSNAGALMTGKPLFQLMEEYGFQDSYIAACKQLYFASNTYYMTIHGNTIPLSIYRGTLQGDMLSPFLFTLFMEPLLRWLAVGSQGL